MSSAVVAAVATYYVACSAFIYIKVSPWCSRPQQGENERPLSEGTPPPSDGKAEPLLNNNSTQLRLSAFKRMGSARTKANSNPFYSDCWHLSPGFPRLKLALFGPVLVPLRGIGILVTLLIAAFLSSVAVAGVPRKNFECGSTVPLSGWRRIFRAPILVLGRVLLFCMGYMRIEEEGTPADLSEAPIVVSNHLGPVEPLILAIRTGGMPVSRLENASLPLFGPVVKAFLPIFVDRINADSRTAVREEIESRARGASSGLYKGPVFLFPEGTCSNGTSVITFKVGAFNPRLPIQPAVIEFPHSPGDFYPCWTVVAPSLPELLFRMLCQPWNRCKITWLPSVHPNGEDEMTEWPGPKLYAARVQGMVAASLGSESTQFAFEDVKLMHEARKFGDKFGALARGGAAVELRRVQAALPGLDIDEAKQTLEKFHSLDANRDGQLTFEEFRAAFGADLPTEYAKQMFDLLDDDCSGRLDFREFLVGSTILQASTEETVDDALKFAFKTFDLSNKGKMDFASAQRILRVIYPDANVETLRTTFQDMDKNGNGMLDEAEFVAWVKDHEETLPQMKKVLFVQGETKT